MSRRAKELFEVLAVKEGQARSEGPRPGGPRPRRARAADPDAAAARAGIGGRSFPLTVNQGLLIAVLLVLTNAASFVVGKRQGSPDAEESALRRGGPPAARSPRAAAAQRASFRPTTTSSPKASRNGEATSSPTS